MKRIYELIQKNMTGGNFTSRDEYEIRECILNWRDNFNDLEAYINLYWQNFPINNEVLDQCGNFICSNRFPGISGASMSCVNDTWGVADKFVHCIMEFLDTSKFSFEIWNFEIEKSYRIVLQNSFFSEEDVAALKTVYSVLREGGVDFLPELR